MKTLNPGAARPAVHVRFVVFIALASALALSSSPLHAQVGVGTTLPQPNAALDVRSTGGPLNPKGLIIPRLTGAEVTNLISILTTQANANNLGMMVYNLSAAQVQVWNGTTFVGSGAGTVSQVSTGAGLTGGPITGTGTISADFGATGIVSQTGTGPSTFAARTITGTVDQVNVANGTGVGGNPTISLNVGAGANQIVQRGAGGVITGDITGNAATATTAATATSATTAGSATNFTGALAGDVTGNQSTTAIANTAAAGTNIVTAINNLGTTGTISASRLPAIAPSGTAAGDLGGTYPSPTVVAVQATAATGNSIVTSLAASTAGTIPTARLNVGTSAGTVAAGNDARFTDARTPTGVAAGDLSGTYPSPTVSAVQVGAANSVLSAVNNIATTGRLNADRIAQGAAVDGQVLKWVNANNRWEPAADISGGASDITGGTGLVIQTGGTTYQARTITGTADQVDVANGTGVGGNPTISLNVGTGLNQIVQRGAGGVISGDITGNAATATTAATATSATTAGSATNFTGALAGDVTGNQSTTAIANTAVAGTNIVTAINNLGTTGTISASRLPAIAPSGAASGDLGGTYPSPTVVAVQATAATGNSIVTSLAASTAGTIPTARLNVGTSAGTVAAGNDARFTDARTPAGTAAGDLGGTYPNPTVSAVQVGAANSVLSAVNNIATTGRLNADRIAQGAAVDGQVLKWVNANNRWEPAADISGGASDITGGTGLVIQTGGTTYQARTITGTADQVNVANGTGVGGNPTISLNVGAGANQIVQRGAGGVITGDITGNAATATTAATATSATTAGSATNFTGALAGDVTGNQSTTAIANTAAAGTNIVTAINNLGTTGTISASRLPAIAPSGTAAGDLGGTYPSPTVVAVQATAATGNSIVTSLAASTAGTIPTARLNVGTSAGTVAAGNDARFTDARTPTGVAAGDLSGTYPSPTVSAVQVGAANSVLSAVNNIATTGRLNADRIAQGAAVDGQVLKWVNANNRWEPAADISGGASDITGGTGLVIQTGASTYLARTIEGAVGEITVADNDGQAGNPTIGLPDVGTAGTFGDASKVPQFTLDAKGRITAVTAVPITTPAEADPFFTANGVTLGGFPAAGDVSGSYTAGLSVNSVQTGAGTSMIAAINDPGTTGTIDTARVNATQNVIPNTLIRRTSAGGLIAGPSLIGGGTVTGLTIATNSATNSALVVANQNATGSALRLVDNTTTEGIGLVVPTLGAGNSYSLTLPPNNGAVGEYLQTNGAGVLTWAPAGGFSLPFGGSSSAADTLFAATRTGLAFEPVISATVLGAGSNAAAIEATTQGSGNAITATATNGGNGVRATSTTSSALAGFNNSFANGTIAGRNNASGRPVLQLYEASVDGSNAVNIATGNLSSSYGLTLPPAVGAVGQYLRIQGLTGSDAQLEWAPAGGFSLPFGGSSSAADTTFSLTKIGADDEPVVGITRTAGGSPASSALRVSNSSFGAGIVSNSIFGGTAIEAFAGNSNAISAVNSSPSLAALQLWNNDPSGGILRLTEPGGASAVRIFTGDITSSYDLTLPAAQGAASTFLQNNGSGVLTWAPAGGLTLPFSDIGAPNAGAVRLFISNTATATGSTAIRGSAGGGGGNAIYGVSGTTTSSSPDAAGLYGTTSTAAQAVLGRGTAGSGSAVTGITEGTSTGSAGNFSNANAGNSSPTIYGLSQGPAPVLQLDNTVTGNPLLRLRDLAQGTTVNIAMPAAMTSYSLTLPPNAGAANQFLQTNGTGALTWASAGLTLPFNDAGGATLSGARLNVLSTDITSGTAAIRGTTSGTGDTYGLQGITSSTSSGSAGVYGSSSTDAPGIVAENLAGGAGNAITALANSTGAGVFARNSGTGPSLSVNGNQATAMATFQNNSVAGPALTLIERGLAGAQRINLVVPNTMAADYTLTLPAAQGGASTYLQNDGTGVLTWAAGGGAPSGAASGDLGGTYPSPTVVAVQATAATGNSIVTSLAASTAGTIPTARLNVGTLAGTVAAGNDTRFTDARTPSGTAAGDLGGTYPSPTVVAVQATAATGNSIVTSLAASTAGTIPNARTTATALATPNTIVLRDATGNFAANNVTVNDINATTATIETATVGGAVGFTVLSATGNGATVLTATNTSGAAAQSTAVQGTIGASGSSTSKAVEGINLSTTAGATGVLGTAEGATGIVYGVRGTTASNNANAAGVYGQGNGGSIGVRAESNDVGGPALRAQNTNAAGPVVRYLSSDGLSSTSYIQPNSGINQTYTLPATATNGVLTNTGGTLTWATAGLTLPFGGSSGSADTLFAVTRSGANAQPAISATVLGGSAAPALFAATLGGGAGSGSAGLFQNVNGANTAPAVDVFTASGSAPALRLRSTFTGVLSMYDSDGSNFIQFAIPNLAGNSTYTWPTGTPGTTGVLTSDNTGNLTWGAAGLSLPFDDNSGAGGATVGNRFRVINTDSTANSAAVRGVATASGGSDVYGVYGGVTNSTSFSAAGVRGDGGPAGGVGVIGYSYGSFTNSAGVRGVSVSGSGPGISAGSSAASTGPAIVAEATNPSTVATIVARNSAGGPVLAFANPSTGLLTTRFIQPEITANQLYTLPFTQADGVLTNTGGTLTWSAAGLSLPFGGSSSAADTLFAVTRSGANAQPAMSATVLGGTAPALRVATTGTGNAIEAAGDITFDAGTTRNISVGSSAAAGTALNITAGAGGTGDGGTVSISGGTSNTGAGGVVNISGANASAVGAFPGQVTINGGDHVTTDGPGGAVTIRAGESRGNYQGGTLNLHGGAAVGTGIAGGVTLRGGNHDINGFGGSVTIEAGSSSAGGLPNPVNINGGSNTGAGGWGGPVNITGGTPSGALPAVGGNVTLRAGGSAPSGGSAGGVYIEGGQGASTANGGIVSLTGGATTSGSGGGVELRGANATADGESSGGIQLVGGTHLGTLGAGGSIDLTAGTSSGTTMGGNVNLTTGSAGGAKGGSFRVLTGLGGPALSSGDIDMRASYGGSIATTGRILLQQESDTPTGLVGIGTGAPTASLDIQPVDGVGNGYPALRLRQQLATNIPVLNRSAGDIIFDSGSNQPLFYNGTAYVPFGGGAGLTLPFGGSSGAADTSFAISKTGANTDPAISANALSDNLNQSAIFGRAAGTTLRNFGVRGATLSADATSAAVYGQTTTAASGVLGEATVGAGAGVRGRTLGTANGQAGLFENTNGSNANPTVVISTTSASAALNITAAGAGVTLNSGNANALNIVNNSLGSATTVLRNNTAGGAVLQLRDADNSNSTQFIVPNLAADQSYTLPAGQADGVLTNTGGTLSWNASGLSLPFGELSGRSNNADTLFAVTRYGAGTAPALSATVLGGTAPALRVATTGTGPTILSVGDIVFDNAAVRQIIMAQGAGNGQPFGIAGAAAPTGGFTGGRLTVAGGGASGTSSGGPLDLRGGGASGTSGGGYALLVGGSAASGAGGGAYLAGGFSSTGVAGNGYLAYDPGVPSQRGRIGVGFNTAPTALFEIGTPVGSNLNIAPFRLEGQATAPTLGLADGAIYYNTTTGQLNLRHSGAFAPVGGISLPFGGSSGAADTLFAVTRSGANAQPAISATVLAGSTAPALRAATLGTGPAVRAGGDIEFENGANRTINIAQSTGVGNTLSVASGAGAAGSGGGVLNLAGGQGGTGTTNGGALNIDGGAPQGTGSGGAVNISGGAGAATTGGGAVNINGANGGTGGNIRLEAGDGSAGVGGNIQLIAGNNGSAVTVPGFISLQAGSGTTTGLGAPGADISLTAGNGNGTAARAGGDVSFTAGNGSGAGNGPGGNLNLLAGNGGGTGLPGTVFLQQAAGAPRGRVAIGTNAPTAFVDINNNGIIAPLRIRPQAGAPSGTVSPGDLYADNTNLYFRDNGGNWLPLAGAAGWGQSGTSGTTSATNYIGTSDNNGLRIRTNNATAIHIDSLQRVALGTASPIGAARLTVNGDIALSRGGFREITLQDASAGAGDLLSIRGAAGAAGASGGEVRVSSGASNGTGTGGSLELAGGSSFGASGTAGRVVVRGGNGGTATSTAGNVFVTGGPNASTPANVGNAFLGFDPVTSSQAGRIGVGFNTAPTALFEVGNPAIAPNNNANIPPFRIIGQAGNPTLSLNAGALYYNSTANEYRFYNGTAWSPLGGTGWGLTGTALTDSVNQYLGTSNDYSLVFRTNAQPRMRINRNGGVIMGDGVSAAASNNTGQGGVNIQSNNSAQLNTITAGNTNSSELNMFRARGSLTGLTAVQANDAVGQIRFRGWSGTDMTGGAFITARAEQAFTALAAGTNLAISTTSLGATNPTQRMVIGANGNVAIGPATPPAAGRFLNVFATSGGANAFGSIGDYNAGPIAGTGDDTASVFRSRYITPAGFQGVSAGFFAEGINNSTAADGGTVGFAAIMRSNATSDTNSTLGGVFQVTSNPGSTGRVVGINAAAEGAGTGDKTGLQVDVSGTLGAGTTATGINVNVAPSTAVASSELYGLQVRLQNSPVPWTNREAASFAGGHVIMGNFSLADTSAMLDVQAGPNPLGNPKGLLLPRVANTAAFTSPNITDGMLVYQTGGTPGLYVNQGAAWVPVGGAGWGLGGSALTDSTTQYLGTSNAFPLVLRTNGIERMRINGSTGRLTVGATPDTALRVSIRGATEFLANTSSILPARSSAVVISNRDDGGSPLLFGGRIALSLTNVSSNATELKTGMGIVMSGSDGARVGIQSQVEGGSTTANQQHVGVRGFVGNQSGIGGGGTSFNAGGRFTVQGIKQGGNFALFANPFILNGANQFNVGVSGEVLNVDSLARNNVGVYGSATNSGVNATPQKLMGGMFQTRNSNLSARANALFVRDITLDPLRTSAATFVGRTLMRSTMYAGDSLTLPHPRAILELQSTTQGFLMPRMSAGQRTSIASPAKGLMVIDTVAGPGVAVQVYDGSAWQSLGGGASNPVFANAGNFLSRQWGLTGPSPLGTGEQLLINAGNGSVAGSNGGRFRMQAGAGTGAGSVGGEARLEGGISGNGPGAVGGGAVLTGGAADNGAVGGQGATLGGDATVAGALGGGIALLQGGTGIVNGANGGGAQVNGGSAFGGTNANGGEVSINGGQAAAAGTAGNVFIRGGQSATGFAGTISMTGGQSTAAAGGNVDIRGGSGPTGAGQASMLGGDAPAGGVGGNAQLQGGFANVTGATQAGSANLVGGNSFVAGASAGAAVIQGGVAFAASTGNGGAVVISGGQAQGPGGNGGGVQITSGTASGSAPASGGDMTMTAGNSAPTGGFPGSVYITAGQAIGSTNVGGRVSLTGGVSSAGSGGGVELRGANASALFQSGGGIQLFGGAHTGTSGQGGGIELATGTSTGAYQGGDLSLSTGNAASNRGGNISLTTGNSTGSNGGSFRVLTGVGGPTFRSGDIDMRANYGGSIAATGRILLQQESNTPTGLVGIGTNAPTAFLDINNDGLTSPLRLRTQAAVPAAPNVGDLYADGANIYYRNNASAWLPLAGGAGGGVNFDVAAQQQTPVASPRTNYLFDVAYNTGAPAGAAAGARITATAAGTNQNANGIEINAFATGTGTARGVFSNVVSAGSTLTGVEAQVSGTSAAMTGNKTAVSATSTNSGGATGGLTGLRSSVNQGGASGSAIGFSNQVNGTNATNPNILLGEEIVVTAPPGSTSTVTGSTITASSTGTGQVRGLIVSATGGATPYAALFTGGRVGIGTTTPATTLEITGDQRFTAGGIRTIDIGFPAAGAGDALIVTAGGGAAGSNGGAITLRGGQGNAAGAGGTTQLWGGGPGATGAGGAVSIQGSSGGATSGAGGAVTIEGGSATAGNSDGGDITLSAGTRAGTGASGDVTIYGGGSTQPGNVILAHTGAAARGRVGINLPGSQIHQELSMGGSVAGVADDGEGVLMDMSNFNGAVNSKTGIRFRNNTATANERFNAAIFSRLAPPSVQHELMFGVQPNDGTNIVENDMDMVIREDGVILMGTTTYPTSPGLLNLSGNLQFLDGTRTISVQGQPLANTAGFGLSLASGAGNGTGAGGQLLLNGGTGGASGAGGQVTIFGGTAGPNAGGNVRIYGGAGALAGNIFLAHNGSFQQGNVYVGAASAPTLPGGILDVTGNMSFDGTNAREIFLRDRGTSGSGFALTLRPGDANTTGAGGGLILQGGAAAGGSGIGGSVVLQGGTGAAAPGGVRIGSNVASPLRQVLAARLTITTGAVINAGAVQTLTSPVTNAAVGDIVVATIESTTAGATARPRLQTARVSVANTVEVVLANEVGAGNIAAGATVNVNVMVVRL
jgi:hypothetical protein